MSQGFKPLPDYWYNALIDATAQYLPHPKYCARSPSIQLLQSEHPLTIQNIYLY
jgi:hypothetical protein